MIFETSECLLSEEGRKYKKKTPSNLLAIISIIMNAEPQLWMKLISLYIYLFIIETKIVCLLKATHNNNKNAITWLRVLIYFISFSRRRKLAFFHTLYSPAHFYKPHEYYKQTNKQATLRTRDRAFSYNKSIYTRIEMSKLIKRNSYANLCFQKKGKE